MHTRLGAYACKNPTTEPAELAEQLESLTGGRDTPG